MSATSTVSSTVTFTEVKKGELIPDGVHFRSENGVHCYKLPRATFDQVLSFGAPENLANVKAYSTEKLARAAAWVAERIAEKTDDVYLILPVSKAKQKDTLGWYLKRARAFQAAIKAEQMNRQSDALFV